MLASLGLAKQNWHVNQLLLNATCVAAAWIYPCADRAAIKWARLSDLTLRLDSQT